MAGIVHVKECVLCTCVDTAPMVMIAPTDASSDTLDIGSAT